MATAATIDLGMSITARQEAFGNGFVLSLAAAAGCTVSKPCPDDDSIDWTFSSRLPTRPKLDVQLKTWMNDDGEGDALRYPLKLKNYDDLRLTNVVVPRLLIVVAIPSSADDWTNCSAAEVGLRHCAYWVSLRDMPNVSNTTSVTVHVPRANIVTPTSLKILMKKVDEEVPL